MSRQISSSLTPFRFPGVDVEVSLSVVHGIVVADKIWSQTHVQSFGGGGYLNQGTGIIHAPTVSSFATTKREVWIRTPAGTETSISTGEHAKANSGNDVSIVYRGSEKNTSAIALVNRTTGNWHTVQGSFKSVFLSEHGLVGRPKRAGVFRIVSYIATSLLAIYILETNTRVLGRTLFVSLYAAARHLPLPYNIKSYLWIRTIDDVRTIYVLKAFLLALAGVVLVRKALSWVKVRAARHQTQLAAEAFEKYCEGVCQSLF